MMIVANVARNLFFLQFFTFMFCLKNMLIILAMLTSNLNFNTEVNALLHFTYLNLVWKKAWNNACLSSIGKPFS